MLLNREQEKAMHARLGSKHRTFYDPRGDLFFKETQDEPKLSMDDREEAYTFGHNGTTRFDRERGIERSTAFWQRGDHTSRSPLKTVIKKEIKTAKIPTGQENEKRWMRQLGTAGLSTPSIMKEKMY